MARKEWSASPTLKICPLEVGKNGERMKQTDPADSIAASYTVDMAEQIDTLEDRVKERLARLKATVGKLGIMGQIGQMLPKPEKPAKPKEVSFKDQFTLNKEVLELAMPEIQRLENQFDQEAKKWFGSIPKNWRQDPATKARFESEKQAIIARIRNQLDPRHIAAPEQTLSPEQIQRLRERGK